MAEHHYVDPKDQTTAAEGVADHSDLTTFYAEARHEDLGPWMSEDARQKSLQADRDTVVRGLRKSALLVGLCISLPVVIGIVLGQFFMTAVSLVNAIPILFLIIFGFGGFLGLTYALFKWVGQSFHNHNLRALPITLTTLASLFFLIRPTFEIVDTSIGGLTGYGVGLISLLVMGVIIATVAIFAWTSQKVSGIVKILVLLAFFGTSVVVAYLI